jgi:hypothetical protein
MEKLNKKRLIQFLNKIYLQGTTSKVWIETKDGKTFVNAKDDNGNLMTSCKINVNLFDNDESIGIYDVGLFIKYLNNLDAEEVSYRFQKLESGQVSQIDLSKGYITINYYLCSKDNIPEEGELKKEPKFHFKIKLTDENIPDIIKALDTTGTKVVYFTFKNEKLLLNIGDISSKENIIKYNLKNYEKVNETEVDSIAFNSNYFRSIINNNSPVILEIAMDGLLKYSNEIDNINTTYLQRSLITKEV